MTLELSSIELSTIALIAKLANLSFSQGVFPSKYKFAIVTPLLKKTYSRRSKPGQLSFRILITFLRFLKSYSCPGFRHMCGASDNFSSAQSTYRRHYHWRSLVLAFEGGYGMLCSLQIKSNMSEQKSCLHLVSWLSRKSLKFLPPDVRF